ncbi:hypothetical protein Tcan_13336 [Toxocara canis]|uniref:Chitin-binding type-2 domain-containing protein n=1 Tax=Toxocara canis TaxID=6265 RepID=A0A0B2VJ10_TOXCA|nr:hypothetical protein Tcan_13336 [Toxocara canis]
MVSSYGEQLALFATERGSTKRSAVSTTTAATTLLMTTKTESTPSDHELCIGRQSGLYAKGCSGDVLWCTDGAATHLSCPPGYLYEQESRRCVPRESMAECPPDLVPLAIAQLVTTSKTPTQTITSGKTTEESVQLCANEETNEITGSVEAIATSSTDGSGVPRGPAPISDSFCENHEDGTYGERCSARFVLCLSHETLFFNCSDSFVFDPIASECVPLVSHAPSVYLMTFE